MPRRDPDVIDVEFAPEVAEEERVPARSTPEPKAEKFAGTDEPAIVGAADAPEVKPAGEPVVIDVPKNTKEQAVEGTKLAEEPDTGGVVEVADTNRSTRRTHPAEVIAKGQSFILDTARRMEDRHLPDPPKPHIVVLQ